MDLTAATSCVAVTTLVREADLIPLWNPLCSEGGIAKLVSPTEMLGFALVTFNVLPLPAMFVLLHAIITLRAPVGESIGLTARTADEVAYDRTSYLPKAVCAEYGELKLAIDAEMTPVFQDTRRSVAEDTRKGAATQPPGPPPPPRTRVVGECTVNVTALGTRLGRLVQSRLVIGLILTIIVPLLWRAFLRVLQVVGRPDSEWGARVRDDATGLYRLVRDASGQPDVELPMDAAWDAEAESDKPEAGASYRRLTGWLRETGALIFGGVLYRY